MSDTKSTKREITFWWNSEDRSIHIACNDYITTLNRDGSSERGHPKLFEWLRMQLKDDGKPAPAEAEGFQRTVSIMPPRG
jgi:hypothetical protein